MCTLIAGAVILGILIFTTPSTPTKACLKPACRGVLEYMDSIVDKSVKPCHDFYRHVCGRWLGNTAQPGPLASSFMAEVLRNYTARRHRAMMARKEALAEPADSVSRYYRNCVAYLGVSRTIREIVDKVLEVSGTNLDSWLKMSSEETFLKLLQLSFFSRLNALFRVTAGVIENKNKTCLVIDRWISFKNQLPKTGKEGQGNTYLTAVLKGIGTDTVNDTLIAQCHALDNSIGLNETLLHRLRPSLAPASAADCAEFPPDKWIQGTKSHENVKLPNGTDVLASDFKATCNDVKSVLLHKLPPVRTLYPLALLAVEFLKLDFMLTTGPKQPKEEELVQRICHQDTVATFKRLWFPALSKVLSISPATADAMSGYFSALKDAIVREVVKYPKWMSTKDRMIALARAEEMRIATFSNGTLSSEEMENSRFHQSLEMRGNDWISNKAIVLRRTKAPDDVDEDSTIIEYENFETLETQLTAVSTTITIVVPHMFALPPITFADIPAGTYANLAMFGFHIARKVMSLLIATREISPWSNDTDIYYAAAHSCYANNSGTFHGLLNDTEFDEAVGAALALRVVLRIGMLVARTDLQTEAQFYSPELFFRRACLSLCAGGQTGEDFNSLDRDTASAACTLAVSNMEAFHRTFGCRGHDQMAAPWRCRI